MTKKRILDLEVTANLNLNENYVLIKASCSEELPVCQAGQFAQLRVDGSKTTYLRRPISINWVDKDKNEVWFLIQKVGAGTQRLGEYQKGDLLNVILPLGNSFKLPESRSKSPLLVGGGVGVAPMLWLGKQLQQEGYEPIFLLGARSKHDLLELEFFKDLGTVYTTTEDGSFGEKGYVTQHSILRSSSFSKIYSCGPKPMMQAIAAYAKQEELACELSLENTMACGIGACLCCVEDSPKGHVCACTEGPVFDLKDLLWEI